MFCSKCGERVSDTAKLCDKCGYKFKKNKKKRLSSKGKIVVGCFICLTILLYFGLFYNPNPEWKYRVVWGSARIEGYREYMGHGTEVVVPKEVGRGLWMDPYIVDEIEVRAFWNCSRLTSIEIPKGVKRIREQAFCRCSSLTSMEIPSSVIEIEEFAFSWCSSLVSVEIPEGVKIIGEDAFRNCSSLTSIEIPNSVIEIGEDAFLGCSSLTRITIPNGLDISEAGIPDECEIIRR